MAETPPPSDERRAGRMDRLVKRLLAGRRLEVTPADAEDRDAIMAAARLAGSREARPHMSPALRRRLAARLGVPPPVPPPSWVSRRIALTGAAGIVAGVVAGAGGGELAQMLQAASRTPVRPPPTPGSTAPPASPGVSPPPRPVFQPSAGVARWVDTGLHLDDMVDGVPKRVAAGAVEAFVVRRDGQLSAMSSYCTHFPCELVWQSSQRVLLCPCHNRSFTTDGVSTETAYPLPSLPLVQVRVVDGRIQILGT